MLNGAFKIAQFSSVLFTFSEPLTCAVHPPVINQRFGVDTTLFNIITIEMCN